MELWNKVKVFIGPVVVVADATSGPYNTAQTKTVLTNDAAATFGLTGAGGNTTGGTAALGAGADPSGFQFGVMHKF